MKVVSLSPAVLSGQGSIGSFSLSAPTSVPSVGPMAGDAGNADVMVSFSNPGDGNGAEASEPMPGHLEQGGPAPIATPAPSMTETVNGGPHTVMSQYSTQGPIPKG
jgi:hypothetical protein